MKKFTLFLLLVSAVHFEGAAQVDPHFSQFYAHPLWLNPALTGAFDGRVRASAIYRSQWAGVAPYKTTGVSADLRTDKNINIGISFLQQAAGDAGYRYQTGGLSVSYSGVRFGADAAQQVQLGLQVGYLGRSFDASALRYGSQWSAGIGFDPSRASGDNSSQQSSGSFDASAGATWMDTRADAVFQPFAGVAVGHLTRPEDPFYSSAVSRLPMRLTVHGGFKYALGEAASLQVQLLYLRQGTSELRMGGAGITLGVNDNTDLLFGSSWRIGDAVSPYAGLRYGSLTLGASYDHNISDLSKLAGNTNAMELSLSWILAKDDGYVIPCPSF